MSTVIRTQITIDLLKAKTIGEFCKGVRVREELSQREMAKKLKVTSGLISQVETDHYEIADEYAKKMKEYTTKQEFDHLVSIVLRNFEKKLRGE